MSAHRKTTTVRSKSSLSKVRPSPEIIEAKRKAAAEKKLHKEQFKKSQDNYYISDMYQSVIDTKTMIRLDTGLVYSECMTEHRCLWDENYPECPERFTRILERCQELGLIDRCKSIEPRLATHDELLLKHTPTQIDILKATDECTDVNKLEKISSRYDAIYIHPSTYKLSRLATGSTINLLEAICRRQVQNGMAIIRPPGHHAMKSEYCGYCFFNNVAIGAEKMLRERLANKILIVDWDVHHGQATQQMFYDDPRVVYFSIHRYEYGEFWPNLRESDFHYVGENAGRGYNFNIPLNKTGMTNADYLAIFQQLLMPMAYEYQPDLIIVSAGYDAALGCPEGEMQITPAFYSHLLSPLLALAGGRVAVILEGGYCLESLSESAALTLRTLLGDPCPSMTSTLEPPSTSIRETILNVIYSHKPYWKCYEYQDVYSIHSKATEQTECNRHLPVVIFKGNQTKPESYETRNCYPTQSEAILNDFYNCLLTLKRMTNLNVAPYKLCLVYDERMLKHCNASDGSHPETPRRISAIYAKHEEYDLLKRCHSLQGRMAIEEELILAHTKEYINSIRETEGKKISDLKKQAGDLDSIYFHPATWISACVATGSLLQVVDSVLNGESQSGVAIIRPPGHHADEDIACGFCIFNNIAVAARYATHNYGLNRVLIVDWDIHHGNGTQSILEEDPKILYISIHRYDNGSFFPHSKDANYDVVGTGKGEGFNVNIPWNRKKMSDSEYIAAFQQVVMPIAYQFNPELVLISAGFDACIGDPLGGYTVSPTTYGHFTHWLSALANGRIILTLEGGYNVNSISYAMTMCTKSLLGDPLPIMPVSTMPPCASAVTTIKNVLKTQKQYWPNLIFQASLPKENIIPEESCTLSLEKSDNHSIVDISSDNESKIMEEQWRTEKDLIVNVECKMSMLNIGKDSDKNKLKKPSVDCETEKKPTNKMIAIQNERAGCSKESNNEPFDNFFTSTDSAMYAVVPLANCPHLKTINDVPDSGIDIRAPCCVCKSEIENWICLHCYTIHCARNINQHAIIHGHTMEHFITLSFMDLSVWCYACEAYIDNPRLHAAKSAAYKSKFNEVLPWAYETTQHEDD